MYVCMCVYTCYSFKSNGTISVQSKFLHVKRVVHVFMSNKKNSWPGDARCSREDLRSSVLPKCKRIYIYI